MLEKGTYHDTDEKEYRAWPGMSYSRLASFYESQDHALIEMPPKSFFEFGNAFELIIEDRAKGTDKFNERFFVCGEPGEMPEKLAGWIEGKEDLDDKYVWNQPDKKTGEIRLNKKHKRLHGWLDACQNFPGKMPKGKDEMETLEKMVDNFFKMEVFGHPLSEILPAASFQVPIVWYVGKVRKKALLDVMLEAGSTIYAFDIKTAADMKRFCHMLKDKYWVQEAHYTAGLRSIFPDHKINWQFLVSSKAVPNISQPFAVDETSQEYAMDEYFDLCTRFDAWNKDGRPPKGWKEFEPVKVFFS